MTGGINDTKSVKTTVGMRIQEAREKKKLSRIYFSDFLNTFENRPITNGKIEYMNQDRLKSWEYGVNPVPLEWIPLLCSALDCDVGYLFGDYPEPKRTTSDVVSVTGLSELSVEKLAHIHTFSNGSDVYSNIIQFLSFLIEGIKPVFHTDDANIMSLVVKAHEAIDIGLSINELKQVLKNKPTISDADYEILKSFDLKAMDDVLGKDDYLEKDKIARERKDIYDAKLYHCEKTASALISEYIKMGVQNG